jgi:hypothetical protein
MTEAVLFGKSVTALRSNVDAQITGCQNVDKMTKNVDFS